MADGPYGELKPVKTEICLSDWRESLDAPGGSLHAIRKILRRLVRLLTVSRMMSRMRSISYCCGQLSLWRAACLDARLTLIHVCAVSYYLAVVVATIFLVSNSSDNSGSCGSASISARAQKNLSPPIFDGQMRTINAIDALLQQGKVFQYNSGVQPSRNHQNK